jgi:hypothetical protein
LDACKEIGRTKDGPVWGFDLEEVGARFKMGFTRRIGLLQKPFKEQPVVQLEFQAIVPWLLAEPEREI